MELVRLAMQRPDPCPDGFTLASWIAGELSPKQHTEVAAHLAVCNGCAEATDEAAEVRNRLQREVEETSNRIITWGSGLASNVKKAIRDALDDLASFPVGEAVPVPIQGARRSPIRGGDSKAGRVVLSAEGEAQTWISLEIVQAPSFNRRGDFSAAFNFDAALPDGGQLWLIIDLGRIGALRIGPARLETGRQTGRFDAVGGFGRGFQLLVEDYELVWTDGDL
ncbi:MAG: zf-HC2 domain-containing protein [Pseudomonadota bacterium]